MKRDLLDLLYEWSIVGSYTNLGFKHRAKSFDPTDLRPDLHSRTFVVTGANSGIGFATTQQLSDMGARVIMACRNFDRGMKAYQAIKETNPKAKLSLAPVDVSELGSVHGFCDWLDQECDSLDGLVHNAGVLVHQHQETTDGHELTLATHLLGPHLMTNRLLTLLRQSDNGRVIFVTSGGMYTQRLNLDYLFRGAKSFDGVKLYAQAKRAQVILTEELAETLRDTSITVNAMHPGWADTPGVEKSLPSFHQLLNSILRTPLEGADTAIWLASSKSAQEQSGKLFLDRVVRRTHVFPWTRESLEDRRDLLSSLTARTFTSPEGSLREQEILQASELSPGGG